MEEKLQDWYEHTPHMVWNIVLIAISILAGILLRVIFSFIVKESTKVESYSFTRSVIKRLSAPFTYLLPLVILNISREFLHLGRYGVIYFYKAVSILTVIAFAYLLIEIVKVVEDYILNKYDFAKSDNLKERKVRTQLQFVRKLFIGLIFILAACAILLSFEQLRKIGVTLLTGVGVGGIIVGFAAQKSLGNFLAGFQIAFTQPIRIDDVLVVEGEWGRVEEITLTYVVIRIWDERRLILPINYFIEKPFQNWTRTGSNILGTIFLYTDYSIPLPALRTEFDRLLQTTELWDKRVSVMQVTNITERTVEVRALVSASDSGRAFDLRCFLRENLLAFVQKNYPGSLPKTRAVLLEEKGKTGESLEKE